jgi:DNA-binding transcriptional LysR family regulator
VWRDRREDFIRGGAAPGGGWFPMVNRLNVSLRGLRYVAAAAERGSVTAAARSLNVAQSAVSTAIAQVEEEFGVQVFVRHHARGVTLTPAGARFVVEARALLAHAGEFAASAGSLGDALRGDLSIGCFVTLGPFFLAGLLAEFGPRYPGIAVEFHEGNQEEILAGIRNGRWEIALTYDLGLPQEIEAEMLARSPPHVLLPKAHRLARRREVALGELASEPLVLLDLPHSRNYFMSLFARAGVQPHIRFRTTSFEMVRSLVGNGQGYAVLNMVPRVGTTYDGKLVRPVPIAGPAAALPIVCIRLKQVTPRRAATAFVEFARGYFIAHARRLGPDAR